MPIYQEFFYELLKTTQSLNIQKDFFKDLIGDSIENNRTLTVNQVLRFQASTFSTRNGKRFAKKLKTVYNILRPHIKSDRKATTKRTDAIDINELVSTYRAVVMNDRKLRQTIGQTISKVG